MEGNPAYQKDRGGLDNRPFDMLSYLANLSLGWLLPSRAFLRFSSRRKDTSFDLSMTIFSGVFLPSSPTIFGNITQKSKHTKNPHKTPPLNNAYLSGELASECLYSLRNVIGVKNVQFHGFCMNRIQFSIGYVQCLQLLYCTKTMKQRIFIKKVD